MHGPLKQCKYMHMIGDDWWDPTSTGESFWQPAYVFVVVVVVVNGLLILSKLLL
jgi:hypothetical protein